MKSLIVCFALACLAAVAQVSVPFPTGFKSPEVHDDHRVTFRLNAPKASQASCFGDWMPPGTSQKMTRDTNGVWSITLGPLPPSIYIYNFILDGVAIADPFNPRIKLRAQTSASLLEMPGDAPQLWQTADVPHGTVEIVQHTSRVIAGETRQVWVYKPPGYEAAKSRRYPVLYLLHGSNDQPAGWTQVGGANFILDNLLARKQSVPMLVVTPFGHAVPFGSPRELQSKNTAILEEYLLKEVMPEIEGRFRVAKGRLNRAIIGYSMGGGQSLQIGLGHLDLFATVGAYSAGVPGDFETRFKRLLDDPKGTNSKLKLLWIGCGKQDSLFARSQALSEMLASRQITHVYRPTEGGHTYTVWRGYLEETVPLLFKK